MHNLVHNLEMSSLDSASAQPGNVQPGWPHTLDTTTTITTTANTTAITTTANHAHQFPMLQLQLLHRLAAVYPIGLLQWCQGQMTLLLLEVAVMVHQDTWVI